MPDIAKSDISPNLDRDKMFSELWWLNYCFCEAWIWCIFLVIFFRISNHHINLTTLEEDFYFFFGAFLNLASFMKSNSFQEGVGIGAVGNPFFGGEAVNICLHSKCEMTDIGDPFCSNIRVCLCLTDQCSLPPAPGSPICVCFNKKLAGGDGWSGQQLFDWSTSFGDYGFV